MEGLSHPLPCRDAGDGQQGPRRARAGVAGHVGAYLFVDRRHRDCVHVRKGAAARDALPHHARARRVGNRDRRTPGCAGTGLRNAKTDAVRRRRLDRADPAHPTVLVARHRARRGPRIPARDDRRQAGAVCTNRSRPQRPTVALPTRDAASATRIHARASHRAGSALAQRALAWYGGQVDHTRHRGRAVSRARLRMRGPRFGADRAGRRRARLARGLRSRRSDPRATVFAT